MSVSGGLARFDLINQIKADVTNLPVKVVSNFESTSLGALILVRLSLGHYNSVYDAAEELVSIRKTIYPDTRNAKLYVEAFKLYLDITKLSGHISPRHSDLMKLVKSHSSRTINNL